MRYWWLDSVYYYYIITGICLFIISLIVIRNFLFGEYTIWYCNKYIYCYYCHCVLIWSAVIYYSICTLGHHFIYPYIHPSILASIYLSHIYSSIHTFILPSMHLYVNPSIHSVIHSFSYTASIHPAIMHLYVLPSICPTRDTYIPPSTYPSIITIQLFIQQLNDLSTIQ